MDFSNWAQNQAEVQPHPHPPPPPPPPPPIDGGDWRSQLQPDSRQRIVTKITETLIRHLPFSGQEGLRELDQIAARFEGKIYDVATSQSDYLRKISLKMLTMESNPRNAVNNATPSHFAATHPGSLDSTAQTSSANVGDWQEEVYQKIKTIKDLYFVDLNEMYQKISIKLQQHDSLPQQPKIEQIEKLRMFKSMLEKLMQVLQIPKNNVSLSHKEKLPLFEKQIMNLLNASKPRKPPQLHGLIEDEIANNGKCESIYLAYSEEEEDDDEEEVTKK